MGLTLRELRAIVEEALADHGLEMMEWFEGVEDSPDGRGPVARMHGHPAMGRGVRKLMVGTSLHGARAMVRRHALTLRRLCDRDADIARHGGDVLRPPAWAHLINEHALRILRNIGVNPVDAVTYGNVGGIGPASGNESRLTDHGEWDLRCLISGTHARMVRLRGHGMDLCDVDGRAMLKLHAVMPETTVMAAKGRYLHDVVQHPFLEGVMAGITRSESKDDGVTFVLDGECVAVENPPSDCSTSWQRVDLHRENG